LKAFTSSSEVGGHNQPTRHIHHLCVQGHDMNQVDIFAKPSEAIGTTQVIIAVSRSSISGHRLTLLAARD
jgi:hypothetical protein